MNKEKIGDYAWLEKGRKYWTLWDGNPFCISGEKIPLTEPKEKIIAWVKKSQAKEKKRFAKLFPEVSWDR